MWDFSFILKVIKYIRSNPEFLEAVKELIDALENPPAAATK